MARNEKVSIILLYSASFAILTNMLSSKSDLLQRQIEVGAVLEGYFQVFQDPDASPRSNRLHKQLLSKYLC